MKYHYSQYIPEDSWLIREEGWVKSLQSLRETQLALGNGFLGTRAILEELPYDAKPGTYIAGIYDKVGSQVAELVNLPNPFNFKITANGEKLGVCTMDVERHKRYLNLKHGLLLRHTIFRDTIKKRYDYQSIRFISMHNKNIGVMQVIFTPLDQKTTVSIETGIDTSVYNAGTVTEGRKKHFRIKEVGQFKNEGYLIIETFSKLYTLIFRSGFYYEVRGKKIAAKDNVFEIGLQKNQTVVFTKIFYIDVVSEKKVLERTKLSSEIKFRKVFQRGFSCLIKDHIRSWEKLWDIAEVSIWGASEIEKNFRFNIYHMLICALKNNGLSSIGARTLTGEGYRGHIFWDAEIFLLPFYIYTMPTVARNMLLYRYRRLDKARENAEKYNFKGVMFPWESAASGEDETPDRAKDLDGKIIKIHTGKMEHHITADIAYALYHYYNVTQDLRFMKDYGYEILFETARFWASRVEYNKNKRKYEINHIIGPDEFHTDVNNNAFTNMMAKWNLITAYRVFQNLKKSDPTLLKKLNNRIGLLSKEPMAWKNISARISINMNKNQIIEQFDGYFKKRKIKINNWDENFIPIVPRKISPRNYNKTQFVKQADVVMLLYLLSDVFSLKTKKQNYAYYIARTIHKSSLSLPVHAVMASEIGDKSMAYRFFNSVLHTDISNIHNNTNDGIHAACMGSTWQIVINGFAGVKIQKGVLSITPRLPMAWRKILFSLYWRGCLLRMEVKNTEIKIRIASQEKKKKLKIKIFGILQELAGSKTFKFKHKKIVKEQKTYYL